MTTQLQYRSVPQAELVGSITDTDGKDPKNRRIRAVFPVGVVDRHSTIWGPDCWTESFRRELPKFLWQHKTDEPLGSVVKAQQLPSHAEVVARFSDTDKVPQARRALAQIEDGTCPGMSFGFHDALDRPACDPQLRRKGVREFVRARMREVSVVTFPSIPGAEVVEVRSVSGTRDGSSTAAHAALAVASLEAAKRARAAGDNEGAATLAATARAHAHLAYAAGRPDRSCRCSRGRGRRASRSSSPRCDGMATRRHDGRGGVSLAGDRGEGRAGAAPRLPPPWADRGPGADTVVTAEVEHAMARLEDIRERLLDTLDVKAWLAGFDVHQDILDERAMDKLEAKALLHKMHVLGGLR